jgi:chaperonin GroEL
VAIIRVGAATETELKEKKHRVEDALSATRAAVEDGIVPGGGVALINAMSALDDLKMDTEDAQIGVNIVRKLLEVPMRKIAENAGPRTAPSSCRTSAAQQKEQGNLNIGYDVLTEEYIDMVKGGVIDPAKVTRGALENAASHRSDDPDHRSPDHRPPYIQNRGPSPEGPFLFPAPSVHYHQLSGPQGMTGYSGYLDW